MMGQLSPETPPDLMVKTHGFPVHKIFQLVTNPLFFGGTSQKAVVFHGRAQPELPQMIRCSAVNTGSLGY